MADESVSENDQALQVQGDRVVLGEGSGDLSELIEKSQELRELMRRFNTIEFSLLFVAKIFKNLVFRIDTCG